MQIWLDHTGQEHISALKGIYHQMGIDNLSDVWNIRKYHVCWGPQDAFAPPVVICCCSLGSALPPSVRLSFVLLRRLRIALADERKHCASHG